MSIIDDLDLLDLPDDLDEYMEFDLDDILSEFRTPGLFDAEPEAEPLPVEIAEELPAEIPAEPLPDEEPRCDLSETMVFPAIGDMEEAPAADVSAVSEALPPEVAEFLKETDLVPEESEAEPAAEHTQEDAAEDPVFQPVTLFDIVEEGYPAEEFCIEEILAEEIAREAVAADLEIEEAVAEEAPEAVMEEPIAPIAAEVEEVVAEEDAADPFTICDILYEFGSPVDDEGVKVYSPADKELSLSDEEDMKVYIPGTEVADADFPAETIPFAAIAEEIVPAQAPTAPAAPKGPGLLAKAAAVVMGLFARKKKSAPVIAAPAPAGEEDPFAAAEALFAQQEQADSEAEADTDIPVDDLMWELELLAELENEKEAALAADEAEERISEESEEEPEIPEAILLLQQEADEAAALAELEAQRAADEEAALAAAREAAMLAAAEEELFEWIESTNKYRGKAIPEKELSLAEEAEETEETLVYIPTAEEESAAEEAALPMLDVSEEEPLPAADFTEEESSEEILSLLENPDTERESTMESPEEEAARRAKADEDLRYTPDEPTAKAIGSHIGKRFSAVFTAFTESGTDCDDEEALGPEVSPTKAYRYFNKFINNYRFRLRLSAVLSVIAGWIALGLPVAGSVKNPAVASALCLMILLTIMLAGADILASGVGALLRKRPGIHSLVLISCLASVVDAIVIIATKGQAGYLPFCAVSGISMCFAIYGSLLYCRGQRLNFKTLEQCAEPLTISVDYGIVDEESTTVYRTIGHPESYIHRSEEEDLSETVYGIITPLLLVAVPVLSVLAALISKGMGDFFHILAALFAASASFSALVAFPLPYFLTQRDLYATKAAIAGWTGAKEIGRVSTMIVTDRDLFPDETVSIKSVRIVDEVNPELTLSYFCSMILESGSCLVPAFRQLADNNDCQIRSVENFKCHEAGGLSGTIGPDEVLIASHSYMKLQGFRIPARKKDSENALFMAANGHVIAYIVMEYKPLKSVRAGLESSLRGNVEMVFAARDFNITPMLISKKFKSPTDTLRFPTYAQRYEITSHSGSETAVCAAVVSRKSFFSYAAVVEKARYLYRSVTWAVTLSVVSSVMGVLLMFIMALTGAGAAITVSRLLIFMLLWLVPTLALAVSIAK